jgi:ribosomal protein S18 acetylase RimI-like enzyme
LTARWLAVDPAEAPAADVLQLRRFEDRDAGAVHELQNLEPNEPGAHLRGGSPATDLHSIAATYLGDGGEFLVGVYDGRVVAMGALRHVTDSVGEVKRMRVHPAFQRRGFARLMLTCLEDRARELRYSRLRVDTAVVRTAAQRLYQSAGYREVGRGQLAGTEVVYYEKRLA